MAGTAAFHSPKGQAVIETDSLSDIRSSKKVYTSVDQPLNAIRCLESALLNFLEDTSILLSLARLYEGIGETDLSQQHYKRLLKEDCTNIESIACIATHHFYSDQPEIALRYFRRILQMGFSSAETFTNIGLCCFYAQQNDLALKCIHTALDLADDDETLAHLWYNVGQTPISDLIARVTMAKQWSGHDPSLDQPYVGLCFK
ncbi:unnamed protein product [Soboliphyme baturini]|uniref:Uncharacterized protein n=1 Tax=Soboliphyme baturini TaxID=241478 RepID=A0A3P8BD82_9BILA|nr:unnamed protein product [Soboliphyme baturini]